MPFSFSVSARWLWHYRAIIAAVCIDWFRCLLRFQTGAVEPLWPLIAIADAVAADVVRAKLLGFNVQAVRHLWEAEKMGQVRLTRTRQLRISALTAARANSTAALRPSFFEDSEAACQSKLP